MDSRYQNRLGRIWRIKNLYKPRFVDWIYRGKLGAFIISKTITHLSKDANTSKKQYTSLGWTLLSEATKHVSAQEAESSIQNFLEVFAVHGKPTTIIKKRDSNVPIVVSSYRLNPQKKKVLRQELEIVLQTGVMKLRIVLGSTGRTDPQIRKKSWSLYRLAQA